MDEPWEKFFSCKKCGEPLAIMKIKGVGNNLVTVGKCPNNHVQKFNLTFVTIDDWISSLESHFYKCVKCNTPLDITPVIKGPWVKFRMKCPVHGKNEPRILPLAVYTKLEQLHRVPPAATPSAPSIPVTSSTPASQSAPNCQYCGGPTKYIEHYSRYYCYKCKRYVEDQDMIERERPAPAETPPNGDDLRGKLKEFADQSDKSIPIALCDIPNDIGMPNIDTYKIEDLLNEMIKTGELAGEVDSVTGYVTFREHSSTPHPSSAQGVTDTPSSETPGNVEAVRDFDYVGGQVRFKVAVRNKSEFVVTGIGVELDIPKEFKLIRILPDTSLDDLSRGMAKIDKLMPNSSQGIDYYLEPVACGTGVVTGLIKYLDAQGNYKSSGIKPREVAIKCPLVFTPEEANIAMVRNLTASLEKDYRRWALPTTPQDSFKLLHDTINQYEIAHINAFQITGTPYEIESWYYTRTKTTNHPITLQISVSEQKNLIDLTLACEDMAELTGLLAKISEDYTLKLQAKYGIALKPAFGNLKELLCKCGSPLPKLPSISESVECNACHTSYSWEMLG